MTITYVYNVVKHEKNLHSVYILYYVYFYCISALLWAVHHFFPMLLLSVLLLLHLLLIVNCKKICTYFITLAIRFFTTIPLCICIRNMDVLFLLCSPSWRLAHALEQMADLLEGIALLFLWSLCVELIMPGAFSGSNPFLLKRNSIVLVLHSALVEQEKMTANKLACATVLIF